MDAVWWGQSSDVNMMGGQICCLCAGGVSGLSSKAEMVCDCVSSQEHKAIKTIFNIHSILNLD